MGERCLVCADFDALPDVVIPGSGAPIVATTHSGGNVDHGTYLVPIGEADIFFPVNFDLLVELYRTAGGGPAEHVSSRAFLEKWIGDAETRCHDGYNPVLDDYTNTRFFVGDAPS